MTSSTYSLLAITIERYFAIVHPFWHRISFTDAKSRATLVAIWCFGVSYVGALVIPTSAVVDGKCHLARFWPSQGAAVTIGILQFFIYSLVPFLTHTICYARIMATMQRRCGRRCIMSTTASTVAEAATSRVEQNHAGEPTSAPVTRWQRGANDVIIFAARVASAATSLAVTSDSQQDLRWKQKASAKRNVTTTLVAVTACYFVYWTPNEVYMALYVSGLIDQLGTVYQATVILIFVNLCVNPVVYIAKYDAFKKGLSLMFRC